MGLVENVSDASLLANLAATAEGRRRWGSEAASTAAATTEPSPASGGRRRTSRSSSSPARPAGLHDGRAGPRNGGLLTASLAHRSVCDDEAATSARGVSCRSEANGVVAKFGRLGASEQQDLINFLHSL